MSTPATTGFRVAGKEVTDCRQHTRERPRGAGATRLRRTADNGWGWPSSGRPGGAPPLPGAGLTRSQSAGSREPIAVSTAPGSAPAGQTPTGQGTGGLGSDRIHAAARRPTSEVQPERRAPRPRLVHRHGTRRTGRSRQRRDRHTRNNRRDRPDGHGPASPRGARPAQSSPSFTTPAPPTGRTRQTSPRHGCAGALPCHGTRCQRSWREPRGSDGSRPGTTEKITGSKEVGNPAQAGTSAHTIPRSPTRRPAARSWAQFTRTSADF